MWQYKKTLGQRGLGECIKKIQIGGFGRKLVLEDFAESQHGFKLKTSGFRQQAHNVPMSSLAGHIHSQNGVKVRFMNQKIPRNEALNTAPKLLENSHKIRGMIRFDLLVAVASEQQFNVGHHSNVTNMYPGGNIHIYSAGAQAQVYEFQKGFAISGNCQL